MPEDSEPDNAENSAVDDDAVKEWLSGAPARLSDDLSRDDRVSLWPLSFEEVLRALHKNPKRQKPHDAES